MSQQSKYVRVKDKTHIAINRIIGRIQSETGERTSADDALWYLVKKNYPDIAEEMGANAHGSSAAEGVEKCKMLLGKL